jgi:hypothetical protein
MMDSDRHVPGLHPTEVRPLPTQEMAELVLDLPLDEVTALEQIARRRGMTTGELLRRLIPIFLACMADAQAGPPGRGTGLTGSAGPVPETRGHTAHPADSP